MTENADSCMMFLSDTHGNTERTESRMEAHCVENYEISRRTFVKGLAAGAAALILILRREVREALKYQR